MIFDRIGYRNNYKNMPELYRALEFLAEMDSENPPLKGAVLDGDR